MTATDARATAPPNVVRSAKFPAQPRRVTCRLSELSRLDLQFSPYLYISPFFVLISIVGLFPMAFTP